MATHASQAVMISAQPAEVMSVIGDFAAYPQWVEALSTCDVLSSHPDGSAAHVRFVVSTGIVQDDYVLAYTWAPSRLRVDWTLVSSQIMSAQVGSYVLAPKGRDTEVTYAALGRAVHPDAGDVQAAGREDDHGCRAALTQGAGRGWRLATFRVRSSG